VSEHDRAPRWLVAYLRWVLSHRKTVVVLLVLASGVAAWSLSRGIISTALAKLFFADNPKYERHKELARRFANDEIVAVAFDEPRLGTPEVFARIGRVSKALGALPWVRRVQTLADLQQITSEDEVLTIRPYGKLAARGAVAARRALDEIRKDPLYGGVFVSRDGKTTSVLIEPKVQPDRPVELWQGYLKQVRAIFVAEGFAASRLHIAGGPTHLDQMITSSRRNLKQLFPLVALVLTLVVFVLYRALWPLLPTLITALIAVLWTMGLSVQLDRHLSVLITVVPAVMLVVAVSDNIHICSAYLLEISEGRSKDEALLTASAEVGLACYYTSITTLLGFASLAFIPAPVIRQMAIVLAFGVFIALWISLTLTPILLSWMRAPKPRPAKARGLPKVVDWFCDASRRAAAARPWLVIGISAVVLGLSGYGISRIRVETDLTKRYPEGVPLRVAERFIAERLAGSNFIDLYVRGEKRQAVLEPKVFAAVTQLAAELSKRKEVDATLSLVDLVRKVHRVIAPPELRDKPPPSRQANAQYLELFSASGGRGDDVGKLVDFERRALRISLRLGTYGVRATAAVAEDAARRIGELLGPSYKVELSGLSYLLGDWLENVLRGQRQGLLFAFITIALVISFALRSPRNGVLSMIPNAAPLIMLGGALGLLSPVVDSDTMMVAIIAIGIAVDDTIHFLTRLRMERRLAPLPAALKRTFAFSGRAIVMTTLILAIGFLPLASASYFTVAMMGTLLPMTLMFAVLADLLLLPALAEVGVVRFEGPHSPSETP
jgi:predicted RND superfamily exporter protein